MEQQSYWRSITMQRTCVLKKNKYIFSLMLITGADWIFGLTPHLSEQSECFLNVQLKLGNNPWWYLIRNLCLYIFFIYSYISTCIYIYFFTNQNSRTFSLWVFEKSFVNIITTSKSCCWHRLWNVNWVQYYYLLNYNYYSNNNNYYYDYLTCSLHRDSSWPEQRGCVFERDLSIHKSRDVNRQLHLARRVQVYTNSRCSQWSTNRRFVRFARWDFEWNILGRKNV